MAPGNGISGLAVAFAAAGGLLVYAGFRKVSPLAALKEISTGTPAAVPDVGLDVGTVTGSAGSSLGVGAAAAGAAAGGAVASAAAKYSGDKYSQLRRTQSGWSDCSSFCDKILTDMGISPPTKWAATANYRMSPEWQNIPLSETRPGDIAINSHHMVMITASGGSAAIGQQNPRVNVRTGTVKNLMSNDYVCKRYVGKK